MDFTKLIGLLESRRLYVPRADQFEDPYECRISKASVDLLRDPARNGGLPPQAIEKYLQAVELQRSEMFVSCWHMSEHESAAMWKLYLQSQEGVAVQSDHEALAAAAQASPLRARTSIVTYVNYDKTVIPLSNLFYPVLHKRLSFAHETELRLVIWASEDVNKPQIASDLTGIEIDVDPTRMIKVVHVSPTAPMWFGTLVEKVVARYGLSCPVNRSVLYDRPTY